VDRIWTVLRTPRWAPAWVGLLAALVLIPLLWSYGFWDPQEIKVADQARELAAGAPLDDVIDKAPPLTVWLVGTSVDWFGVSEIGARIPLALLGILTIVATLLLGRRLGSARAGLLSGLILLGTPMLVFESRQLISFIGAGCGAVLLMLGMAGAIWPAQRRTGARIALYAADALAIVAGAALSYYAIGALIGLFVPVAAFAIAGALALAYRRPDDEPATPAREKLSLYAGSAIAAAVAVGILVWVVGAVFDWVEASPGDHAIFGYTLRAGPDYVEALGGAWRSQVPASVTWDSLFEQIAYGFFPWVALAPFALGRAATGRGSRRRTWAGHLVFFWAALAWIVGTIVALKSGPVRYAAFPALAVACGLWLDDLLASREGKHPGGWALPTRMPAAAVFALIFAVMIGKDLKSFPENFLAMHVVGGDIKFPENASKWLTFVPLAFGAIAGAALWLGIWQPGALDRPTRRERIGNAVQRLWIAIVDRAHLAVYWCSIGCRWVGARGIRGAAITGIAFAMFLSFLYTPKLSHSFSYKYLFDRYKSFADGDEPLGILGMPGSGPEYYAPGEIEKLSNRNELFAFMARPERVFAMGPRRDLCAVHQGANKEGFDYYVLDSSHAKFMLMSNRLAEGERDDNPLKRAIRREPPTDIKYPLSANLEDTLELIGVTMPAEVEQGASFEITLFYKVLKKPTRNWQIFLHFDAAGMRFQGDHWPIDNQCGTAYWQPGDYIADTHKMSAGDMTSPRRKYQVWSGMFVGSHGNWTNMKALSGNPDNADRVPIGTIVVK
jgi:4-amino-4-deoxy-L-arabinose transferase-like glycosyltransferase